MPVAVLAPERSIYLTTFTKCTVSGLRAGYMVAPEHLLPALTGRIVVFGWMATPLMCEPATPGCRTALRWSWRSGSGARWRSAKLSRQRC